MSLLPRTAIFLVFASLGACSAPNEMPTRLSTDVLAFAATDSEAVKQQADALDRMARELLRKSTAKGAVRGALFGCGLAAVSASNARGCVAGAAAGGLTGAAFGRAAGQKEVERRVEIVSPNALVRSIRGMNDHLDELTLSLPDLLAEQDAELLDLDMRRDSGAIDADAYARAVANIRQSRADIADALTASAENVTAAQGNLEAAQAQGQNGLDWHINAAGHLAQDVASARSHISPL
ncbi:MAG: hypothetical protein AB3N17_13440 [Tateyamaria sp.]